MANLSGLTFRSAAALLSSTLPDLTYGIAALPRGAITEIFGGASTGRTALVHMMLATATLGGEISAWIDCGDAFDPASADVMGIDLGKLLLVQCGRRVNVALKAADMILHSGGFGLIVLDLCDAPIIELQRIPLSYWYRVRRAVENSLSVLLVLSRDPIAKSCAARQFVLEHANFAWRGLPPFETLVRMETHATSRKPMSAASSRLEAIAEIVEAV